MLIFAVLSSAAVLTGVEIPSSPPVHVSGEAMERQDCRTILRGDARLETERTTVTGDTLELHGVGVPGSCRQSTVATVTGNVEVLGSNGQRIRGLERAVVTLRTGEVTARGAIGGSITVDPSKR